MGDAIHDFYERGLDALKASSSRPREVHAAFDEESAISLRELLHCSLRGNSAHSAAFGRSRMLQMSFEEELTNERVSGESFEGPRN
jgi:hypothetical protein